MSKNVIEISILHSSDMHCDLEAMSRLSTLARHLHAKLSSQGRRVFLFDAGDAADRRLRFCSLTKGAAVPLLLEAMGDHGYDLQTLGNTISITYGPQAAAEMAKQAHFPILAANFFREGLPLVDGVQPTASFALSDGIQLHVIGLTAQMKGYVDFFGVDQPDFLDSAHDWLQCVKKLEPGPLMVLSHLGLREDRQLAEALPGIDLIVGGHSHSLLPNGERVNGVLIAHAGEYAKHLGQVDLTIDARSGEVLDISAHMHMVSLETTPDPAFQAALLAAEAAGKQVMNQPVGELLEALDHDYYSECGVANLAADAVLERMQADAAMLIGGLLNKGLPQGVVTLGELDEACFTTANPQLSHVRGKQIRRALEYGLNPELMHSFYKAFRGSPHGLPGVGGMVILYDPDAADGERIRKITIQGDELDDERLYRLAHTDAEIKNEQFPFGLLELEQGQVVKVEVPTILREAIADYLLAHSPAPKPDAGRWQKITAAEYLPD